MGGYRLPCLTVVTTRRPSRWCKDKGVKEGDEEICAGFVRRLARLVHVDSPSRYPQCEVH